MSIKTKGLFPQRRKGTKYQILLKQACLTLAIPALLCSSAQAQTVQATAKLDPAKIVVGDQARLFLEVSGNAGYQLTWPAIPDSFGSVEVVEKGKIDTLKNGNLLIYKQRLLITGFDSAVYTIPQISFAVNDRGNTYNIATDSLSFLVSTVLVDTTKEFKPIKGIIAVKGSWLDYIWWIIGAVLLLAAIIIITIILSRRKKPEPVEPVITETLTEKTLRQLRELKAENIWQRGEEGVKEYYVQLTDIIRNYIELRFGVAALEKTTDELMTAAAKNAELHKIRQQLFVLLYTADMAKFAKAQPTIIEHDAAMEAALEMVQKTKPVVVDQTHKPA